MARLGPRCWLSATSVTLVLFCILLSLARSFSLRFLSSSSFDQNALESEFTEEFVCFALSLSFNDLLFGLFLVSSSWLFLNSSETSSLKVSRDFCVDKSKIDEESNWSLFCSLQPARDFCIDCSGTNDSSN